MDALTQIFPFSWAQMKVYFTLVCNELSVWPFSVDLHPMKLLSHSPLLLLVIKVDILPLYRGSQTFHIAFHIVQEAFPILGLETKIHLPLVPAVQFVNFHPKSALFKANFTLGQGSLSSHLACYSFANVYPTLNCTFCRVFLLALSKHRYKLTQN